MRLILAILTVFSLSAFAQSEGEADLSSLGGAEQWTRNSDTFVKNADHDKIKTLVNDLLSENPKAHSEEKSFLQNDSTK